MQHSNTRAPLCSRKLAELHVALLRTVCLHIAYCADRASSTDGAAWTKPVQSCACAVSAGPKRYRRGGGCRRLHVHGGRAGPPPAWHAVAAAAGACRHAGSRTVHPHARCAHVALPSPASEACRLERIQVTATHTLLACPRGQLTSSFCLPLSRMCPALGACSAGAGLRAHGGTLTQLQIVKAPFPPMPVGSRLCHSGSGLLGCHVVTDVPMALCGAVPTAAWSWSVLRASGVKHMKAADSPCNWVLQPYLRVVA